MSKSKVCKRCGLLLSANNFYSDKTMRDGLRTNCKSCMAEQNAERKQSDPERYAKNNRATSLKFYYAHHEQNKVKNKNKVRQRRINNGDHVRQVERTYRANNRQRTNANQRASYRTRNEIHRFNDYLRYHTNDLRRASIILKRLIMRANRFGAPIYEVTPREIIKLRDSACIQCGHRGAIEIDHIIPLRRKGSHSIGNFQPLCRWHNRSKGMKVMTEWKKQLRIDDKA